MEKDFLRDPVSFRWPDAGRASPREQVSPEQTRERIRPEGAAVGSSAAEEMPEADIDPNTGSERFSLSDVEHIWHVFDGVGDAAPAGGFKRVVPRGHGSGPDVDAGSHRLDSSPLPP